MKFNLLLVHNHFLIPTCLISPSSLFTYSFFFPSSSLLSPFSFLFSPLSPTPLPPPPYCLFRENSRSHVSLSSFGMEKRPTERTTALSPYRISRYSLPKHSWCCDGVCYLSILFYLVFYLFFVTFLLTRTT
jgi:hypothetical protein